MTMQEIVVGIGGMSCQGCVKNVSGVLLALPGVERVEVSLATGQANIVYDPAAVEVAQFKSAIEAAGFDVV
jgi:copper chaperone